MKKAFLALSLIIITLTGFGQNSKEYDRVVAYMKSEGYTQTADNRWADIKKGGYTTWWERSYYANLTYAVVAFSDDPDVYDIDVEVRDQNDALVAEDKSKDRWATATFTLNVGATLKIKMTNEGSNNPDNLSRCRYLIFYK